MGARSLSSRVEQLRWAGDLLGRRGLLCATDGNLSAREVDGSVWITIRGVRKDALRPNDLVRIDLEGKRLGGGAEPSSEFRLHLAIYKRRDDVGAIIHAHPPIATGFAAAGQPIPDNLSTEAAVALGPIPVVPFFKPGTGEVERAVLPYISRHDALLLANHGAVAMGRDVEDACCRMERLEHVALTLLTARLLGGVRSLTPEQLARLHEPTQEE
jgi:L-fuculose-phosphate aldolase